MIRIDYDHQANYRGRDPEFAAEQLAKFGRFGKGAFGSNPVFDAEHLYNFPHLSGSKDGRSNTKVFVPGNFKGTPTGPTPT
ncbi:MAG TPA: hypothetical protein VF240_16060 [Pyrinomonadaceae bacterium]